MISEPSLENPPVLISLREEAGATLAALAEATGAPLALAEEAGPFETAACDLGALDWALDARGT